MSYILLILICLLPFSDLILQVRDMWYSQGAVFQIGILCAYSYSLFKKSNKSCPYPNVPLSLLFLWLGLVTCYWWNSRVDKGIYDFLVFMPFFNLLTMVIFYKFIVEYLYAEDIERILKYFSYVIMAILFYCILQYFDLDQFHKHFSIANHPDPVIGTIGNTSHLAGYLTLCLPILYYNRAKLSNIGILLCWGVIINTGSASGLAGAVIVTIFYSIFHRIRGRLDKYLIIMFLALCFITAWVVGINNLLVFINPQGRFEEWRNIYPLLHKYPITGAGFGKILSLNQHWKHAHNEYYQLAIEGGIVALLIVVYGIIYYFKIFISIRQKEAAVCLAAIFLAFLLNSLLNFSAHLWLISSLAMFSYAGLYCIYEEEL